MSDTEKKEYDSFFSELAKQIDTTIDPDLVDQLNQVDHLNLFFKCDAFGNEELIPVGSCVDGSKITLPSDSGDVDVLIISNRIILTESLFDYDLERPAFLHIKVNEDHEKYFKTVQDPINGIYLPISVLKGLKENIILVSRVFLNENVLNITRTRTSAVGKEHIQLSLNDEEVANIPENANPFGYELKKLDILIRCLLIGILNKTDEIEASDDEDETGRPKRKKLVYEEMSLSEVLNTFHDSIDGSRSTNNNDNFADDKAGKQDFNGGANSNTPQNLIEEHTNTMANKSSSENLHKKKRSKNCTPLLKSEILNSNTESKAERDSDTAKNDVAFSIAKSTDYVPAYRFDGWPRVADEWLTRSRKWPSKETMKDALKAGCQVVAKRPLALCNEPISGERDPYFRLSFALSEVHLAKSMREPQLLCWRVLKAYQKCYLETKPKFLTSYHWKNILFWVSESLDESFWTDENVSVSVLKCLDFMNVCLQNQNLPFYFVRKMNMFDGCDGSFFESLRKRVEQIRCSPDEFLKRFIMEPPTFHEYSIDRGELEAICSLEAKEENGTQVIEDMVDAILDILRFSYNMDRDKGEYFKEQVFTDFLQLLKKVRSLKTEEMSSDTDQIMDKLLSNMENVILAITGRDNGAMFKAFDDLSMSFCDLFTSFTENPESKEFRMRYNENIIKTNKIFSTIKGGLFKFVKKDWGQCEPSNVDPMKSDEPGIQIEKTFLDECRKFVNETVQDFKNILITNKSPERNMDTDIDLD
ncbi:uncharacterized protein LOC132748619 [Ruditapes philippinarum]|uniref:uncharacterized protein LOC132748619 n=1 Tax=Ruditapes philippinarum TaxID=129788 RepID=UPI00295AA59F|nr:uncharacterized protein LOC132748619 [Ruditapes philippinarum]